MDNDNEGSLITQDHVILVVTSRVLLITGHTEHKYTGPLLRSVRFLDHDRRCYVLPLISLSQRGPV